MGRDLAAAQLLNQLRLVIFPLVLGPDGEEPIFADRLRTNLEPESSCVLGRLLALDCRPLPRWRAQGAWIENVAHLDRGVDRA
jgi:hypothetical protein